MVFQPKKDKFMALLLDIAQNIKKALTISQTTN